MRSRRAEARLPGLRLQTDSDGYVYMMRAIQQSGGTIVLMMPLLVQAQAWQPVTDEAALRAIMTGTVLSGELLEGVRSISTFNADGTRDDPG